MSEIIERYNEKFNKSSELYQHAISLIPTGGHLSRRVDPFPVYVDEAVGAVKWDADGNELIDFMMGYGALLLGHSHPAVTEAVSTRLQKGTHMGAATALELRWGELVRDMIPSAERVRFTASGTESTLLAIRLSRGFTGKTKLVKFQEHFHGWHDYVSPDSGINTQLGIPGETLSTVVVLKPDISILADYLKTDTDVAAVIVEPTGGHWGQYPLPNPGFLEELRSLTERHGIVMIMDEVICGFRLSRGGAQGKYGVMPDLTTMAKVVAGGMPGGAVAGKADLLDQIGKIDQGLVHPGTFNANSISATAGIATLELIAKEAINERADAMAERLKVGLREALMKMEVPGTVHGVSSIVHIALGVEANEVEDISTVPHDKLSEATAAPRSTSLKLAMLNEGVDMMGGIGFMVSSVHNERDIDRTSAAFERSLDSLRKEQII